MSKYMPVGWGHGSGTVSPEHDTHILVPLLGQEVELDDTDCVMVVLFPRAKEMNGSVDLSTTVMNPMRQAERIFIRRNNSESRSTLDKIDIPHSGGSVTNEQYHKVVRAKFLEIVKAAHINVTEFESIDKDEVFVKLHILRNGEVIKHMAEQCSYRMPVKDSAYGRLEPGAAAMQNDDGGQVPLYLEYTQKQDEFFEPFKPIDQVRILRMYLSRWFGLSEMKTQGIISDFFPTSNYQEVLELMESWGRKRNVLEFPNHIHDDDIKNYFGEEFGFYVHWNTFYIRCLAPLALLGLVHYVITHTYIKGSSTLGYIRIGFAVLVSCWAAVVSQVYKMRSKRIKQSWGLTDITRLETQRPSWDANVSGPWMTCRTTFANVCVFLYIVLVFGVVIGIGVLRARRTELDYDDYPLIYSVITALVIKIGNFLWSKVAKKLVDLQNYHTEERWNASMIYFLSSVKIIVAMWPFVLTLFLKRSLAVQCGHSLDSAAAKVWDPKDFGNASSWTAGSLQAVKQYYTYEPHPGRTCIAGCFPEDPRIANAWTYTDCFYTTKDNLMTFFWINLATELVFLAIPVILARYEIHKELSKASGKQSYTWLQMQAKLQQVAPYEFASWGGSFVEDFNEAAIGYAIVVCFGMLTPVLCFFAFLASILTLRLRAYRMTHVTGRPFPLASTGIGNWEDLFNIINIGGIVCSSLLVINIAPVMHWDWAHKLMMLIGLQYGLFFVRSAVDVLIPETPPDVIRIDDYNDRLKATLTESAHVRLSKDSTEQYHYGNIDLSLNPAGTK